MIDMDVFTVLAIVRRRWLVVLPVLLATVAGAVFVGLRVDPEYEAIGTVLVAGPSSSATTQVGGPGGGGAADGSLGAGAVTPAIVSAIVTSDATVGQLVADGASPNFEITAEDEGILEVTASATDRATAVQTVTSVLAEMERVVTSRQTDANVPEGVQDRLEVLGEPTGKQTRADGDGTFVAEGSARIVRTDTTSVTPLQNLAYSARLLEVAMAADTMKSDVLADAPSGTDYVVEQIRNDPAPLLFVTVTGTDPTGVRRALDAAIEGMRGLLVDRQTEQDIDPSRWVGIDVLSAPESATLASTNLLRPLVAIVGMGLVGSVSLGILVDSWAKTTRRGLRSSQRARVGAYGQRRGSAAVNGSALARTTTDSERSGDGLASRAHVSRRPDAEAVQSRRGIRR